MKKIIGLIAIWLAIAIAALPAFAQQPAAKPQQPAATPQQPAATPQQPAATPQQPAATPQDPQCTPENRLAWYNEFRQQFKGDTAKANELAKKWLACPEVAGEEPQAAYLKNFVTLYEKAHRKDQISDLVYNKKDYAKAIEVGKAILVDEPDNLKVLTDLAYAGFAAAAAKNDAFSADAITYAKKAMQLIDAGKGPDKWDPYLSKDDALAYLNNIIGSLTVQKNPTEALPYLIKVAQYESKLKKLPFTYGIIAGAYEGGEYAKLSADYKAKFGGKDETPESKLALENINQVIDRMVDAYARAVALSVDPASQARKAEWMQSLTDWYKFRHNQTDTGLNEMIASILSKPLPPLPTPITTLPASAPTSTPTSGMNSPGSSPAGTVTGGTVTTTKPVAATTTPANTTPAATTTKPPAATTTTKPPATTTTKPNATTKTTTTPPKPKMKRNHGH